MRVPTNVFFQDKMALVNSHYERLSKLLEQQSSEKKLLAPSDDPVLAGRIKLVEEYIKDLNSFKQNEVIAANRTKLFQSSIDGAASTTDQVKQALQRAASDLISDDDRKALAGTLKSYMNNLLNAANMKDSNGEYIYSGFNGSSQPYVIQNGTYQYQGTLNSTLINIGQFASVLYGESGHTVFGNIQMGNGTFTVTGGVGNTGTASTTTGSVVNQSAYVEDTYTIAFVTNSSGKVGYTITGLNSGQVIPPLPTPIPGGAPDYVNKADITFNGMSINISGTPNVGDTFQIQPTQNQNIFDTLQSAITLLETPIGSDKTKQAAYHQSLTQLRGTVEQAFSHFLGYQSDVGIRGRMIDDQRILNERLRNEHEQMRSELADVEIFDVVSEITRETAFLQSTMESYKLIEKALIEILRL